MKIALLHALPFDERMWDAAAAGARRARRARAEALRPRLEHRRVGARRPPAGARARSSRSARRWAATPPRRSRASRRSGSPGLVLVGSRADADPPERAPAARASGSRSRASRAARGCGRRRRQNFFPAGTTRAVRRACARDRRRAGARGPGPGDRGDPRPARLDRGRDERDSAARRRRRRTTR